MNKASDEKYSEQETRKRFEAALRSALTTAPKPLKEKPKLRAASSAPAKKPTRKP
jgi:hypothetical protein